MLKWILPIAVVALALLIVVALFVSRPAVETAPRRLEPPPVRVLAVEPTSVELTVRSQGSVIPVTEAELVSELAGNIVWAAESFEAGGFFDAGDVLLRLDRRDYELAVASARASVAQARVALTREEAEAEIAREEWEDLGESGEPGPLVLREPQLDEARARVEAAMANQARAELDLERTAIRAPFAGRLRAKRVDRGEFVNRGVPLATIYSVDAAEVTLPVPDSELAFLELPLGTELRGAGPRVLLQAEFAGGRHEWEARIVRIGGEIDPATRMVNLFARVEDPYRAVGDRPPLSVGLFVDAEVVGRSVDSVFEVPRGALVGADRVWLVEDGRLALRQVGVLRSDPDVALVSSGLASGDRISLTILETAVDGMAVIPEPEPRPAPEPGSEPAATVVAPIAATPSANGAAASRPAGPPASAAAAPETRPCVLTGVHLERGAGLADVLLRTGGAPVYRTFWLDDPPRYVVDLSGCVTRVPNTLVAVDGAVGGGADDGLPARFVRVGQYRGGADPVTRVVIDGAAAEDVEPITDALGLRLRLSRSAP
ncbi:MAG: efflux RND transporter periplasmic adaptor subunit [Acidobacteria bacterium]|nr:efflux RND transporter periplasmic adaptor subunit [Acidobacteriota bacterium]